MTALTSCVPLIFLASISLASTSGTLIRLPPWLEPPYLALNLGTLVALVWGTVYILLEPVAGTALALLCLCVAAGNNWLRGHMADSTPLTAAALGLEVVCWVAQFIGHGNYEGRAPALLDNLFQALVLAPLFVWLEVLFALGYRQELRSRVERNVQRELQRFRAEKTAKKELKAQ